MDWLYRSFETSLLALGLALGLAAYLASAAPRAPADRLSVDLPMLTVTAPAAR